MTYLTKKISVALVTAIFVMTMCLPMFILPKEVFADSYNIGDEGPAGGLIFYIDDDYYLEAARPDGFYAWDAHVNEDIGTGTAIGTGQDNTNALIAVSSGAANFCDQYESNGYDDWFLPSKDELNLMYQNLYLRSLGGFTSARYWSSSECEYDNAWVQDFNDGTQYCEMRNAANPTRPIRAFRVSACDNTEQEEVWIRTMPMTCWQVWINEDNNFQFIFWYPYKNNNWVRIYDMEDNMVYEVDVPLNDPHIVVDIPDGMYTVRTYHDGEKLIQEFLIGKP